MPRKLAGYGVFLKQVIRRNHTTGAVMPSGRPLVAALCRYVGVAPAPQRILEVGPGTGAVTMTIVERMRDDDDLCLVEVNETFVAYLRATLSERVTLGSKATRITIVHGRIEDLADGAYDVIVSGLPLNNFTAPQVEQILQGFGRLLKPGGVLSFFEYMAVRSAKALVSPSRERQRLQAIDGILRHTLDDGEFRRDCVWANVPPAWVHHVRF